MPNVKHWTYNIGAHCRIKRQSLDASLQSIPAWSKRESLQDIVLLLDSDKNKQILLAPKKLTLLNINRR